MAVKHELFEAADAQRVCPSGLVVDKNLGPDVHPGNVFIGNGHLQAAYDPLLFLELCQHERIGKRPKLGVEIIADEDPLNISKCQVIWIGKPGSKQEGQVGLQLLNPTVNSRGA